MERCEPIFWSIVCVIHQSQYTLVVSNIPNHNYLISTKRNQVMSIIVHGKILNTGVVTIEIVQNSKGKRIPKQDKSLLTTTCYETLHRCLAVYEGIDTLLVEVESQVLILEIFNLVNVNHTIKWWRDNIAKVLVVLDFSDPSFVEESF